MTFWNRSMGRSRGIARPAIHPPATRGGAASGRPIEPLEGRVMLSAYVVLTTFLFQRGSAESEDPDTASRDGPLAAMGRNTKAPAAVRKGPAVRWLYAHSLGIALLMLFVGSFILHWVFSAQLAADEAGLHGEAAETYGQYLTNPQLWFESFQNWQSEFLSTAVLVVLSIWLRQKDSPESKPVTAPHSQTGTGA